MGTNQKLYAMRDTATGYVKIGISKHPLIRAYQLSGIAKSEVALIFEQDAKDAVVAEKFAHQELSAYRVSGEWFALTDDDLTELPALFDAACQLDLLPPLPKPNRPVSANAWWKLPELLAREKITAYRLHKELNESGVKATPNTIYRWAKELPSSLSIDLLVGVVDTLRDLTGKQITIDDLIEVKSDDPN